MLCYFKNKLVILYISFCFYLIYNKYYISLTNNITKLHPIYINENNLSKMLVNAVGLYNQRLNYLNYIYKKYNICVGKKKVVIVLLPFKNINYFIDRNHYYLSFKYYDELIFFVTEKIKRTLTSEYRGIKYTTIDITNLFFKFPYKFNKSKYKPNYQKRGIWNYQHMCRFFFKDIFLHPIMCNVEMFMRLDSDSLINTSINLFKYMKKNVVYMHNKIMNDGAYVTKGLKHFINSFISAFKIKSKDVRNFNLAFKNNPLLYYNNFEICRISFFRRKEMFQFIYLVDLSYGQFIYRWGDAPLRFISLSLFASNFSKIEIPKEVKYCHHLCN